MMQFAAESPGRWRRGEVMLPVGPLHLVWTGRTVVTSSFAQLPPLLFGRQPERAPVPPWLEALALLALTEGLDAARWRVLDPGLTPLQQAALRAAACIPAGHCASYGEIAQAIGRPRAARAVGLAMSRSPADLLIPTHRVVRHSGQPAESQRGGMGERLRRWEACRLSIPH